MHVIYPNLVCSWIQNRQTICQIQQELCIKVHVIFEVNIIQRFQNGFMLKFEHVLFEIWHIVLNQWLSNSPDQHHKRSPFVAGVLSTMTHPHLSQRSMGNQNTSIKPEITAWIRTKSHGWKLYFLGFPSMWSSCAEYVFSLLII